MPLDFATAPYGRQDETDAIFRCFDAGRNLRMLGPRRLGKTFVLHRLEERAPDHGYTAIRIDVSHCRDEGAFFSRLCEAIQGKRERGASLLASLRQRLRQFSQGAEEGPDSWWQSALRLDWEAFAEHLIASIAEDQTTRWALLIDELPVFLLHLAERPGGLTQVKSIAYRLRTFQQEFPRLRWLVTGSIGLEPLARRGEYLGAFTELHPFELLPLSPAAGRALLRDWAQSGHLEHRHRISDAEAAALVEATGWLSAYYLEALASQLRGTPAEDPAAAAERVAEARRRLLEPVNRTYFETWPEHLRKNFAEPTRGRLFVLLTHLADHAAGLSADALLPAMNDTALTRTDLLRLLNTLEEDGFILRTPEADRGRFRIELLRLWWQRYLPD